jgi:sporulation protein YlmC with PRC-barrel domain
VKKLAIALTATLLSLGFAAGAWGQTRPSSDTGAKPTDDAQRQVWSPDATSLETSKIIGTNVKTPDGTSVGSIDQLIVNPTDGKITHAVIGKGGVLGMGQTKLVFKWSDVKLQHDPDYPDRWHAVVDQAKLDAAPRFEARKGDTAPAASPASPPASTKPKASEPAKKY